jgi:uncharacterized Ntn-hydrolase superfamily protein
MTKKPLTFSLLALSLGIAGAAHAATAAGDLWLHIRVHDSRDAKVSINLPVSVVESLAGALPANTKSGASLRFDDEEVSVAELRRIWRELQRTPDATFLTVDEADSKVRVAKQRGYLVIDARERRPGAEDVQVRIPGTVVDALLSAPGEQLDMAAALRALARHGEGELVTVNGEGETVRIWVDRSSQGADAR